jgi:mRNA interferase RelE/StbE
VKIEFRKSFTKDLKKRKTDKPLLERVKQVILEVEEAQSIQQIKNFRKLKAQGNHYRIRLGNYRFGLIIESDIAIFVRFLPRGDIYKYFP